MRFVIRHRGFQQSIGRLFKKRLNHSIDKSQDKI